MSTCYEYFSKWGSPQIIPYYSFIVLNQPFCASPILRNPHIIYCLVLWRNLDLPGSESDQIFLQAQDVPVVKTFKTQRRRKRVGWDDSLMIVLKSQDRWSQLQMEHEIGTCWAVLQELLGCWFNRPGSRPEISWRTTASCCRFWFAVASGLSPGTHHCMWSS